MTKPTLPCGCGHMLCDAMMIATPARIAAFNATDGEALPVCKVYRAIIGLEAIADAVLSKRVKFGFTIGPSVSWGPNGLKGTARFDVDIYESGDEFGGRE